VEKDGRGNGIRNKGSLASIHNLEGGVPRRTSKRKQTAPILEGGDICSASRLGNSCRFARKENDHRIGGGNEKNASTCGDSNLYAGKTSGRRGGRRRS